MELNQTSQRPVSVTVIGWLLIVFGVIGIIADIASFHAIDQEAAMLHVPSYLFIVSLIVSIIYLVCGFFVLRGADWARWLYVIVSIVLIVIDFVTIGTQMLTGIIVNIIVLVIFSFILFSKQAKPFFNKE